MSKKKLQIGTICRSIRCEREINNGLLLIIVDIDQSVRSCCGEPSPYLIRRLDGLSFPSSRSRSDNTENWFKEFAVWSAGYKLQPIDPDAQDSRDQKVVRKAPRKKVRKSVPATV